MKIIVRGHNLKITEAINAYAEKKLTKLADFFEGITEIVLELEVSKIKNKDRSHTAKILINLPKHVVLRGEEETNDIYAAIDIIADKMQKPLKKQHDRFKDKHKSVNFFNNIKVKLFGDTVERTPNPNQINIKKEKNVAIKPMDPVEAVLQLTKANNDFFVFNNTKTHHQLNIVYNRRNGTYGLQTYKDVFMKRAKLKHFKEMPAAKKYEGDGIKITKIKDIDAPEMNPVDAAKILSTKKDHVFMCFTNPATNQVNVVFKKKGNSFGLIETEM